MHTPDNHRSGRTPRFGRFCPADRALLLAPLIFALVTGCSSPDSGGSGRGITDGHGGGSAAVIREADWAIALRFYSGEGHREQAHRDLSAVARQSGRTDARVRTRDAGSVIVAGRFSGPGDPNALAELNRLKAIRVGEGAPFARAYLAPPITDNDPGAGASELDLAGAKARFGDRDAVYTLELGSYDKGSQQKYRKAAEEEARRLRQQGELAFYYHGRFNSSVTLGLFPESAVDANNRFSPEVDFLKQRFKFLMKNGDRIEMGEGTFWPSRLVRVPG